MNPHDEPDDDVGATDQLPVLPVTELTNLPANELYDLARKRGVPGVTLDQCRSRTEKPGIAQKVYQKQTEQTRAERRGLSTVRGGRNQSTSPSRRTDGATSEPEPVEDTRTRPTTTGRTHGTTRPTSRHTSTTRGVDDTPAEPTPETPATRKYEPSLLKRPDKWCAAADPAGANRTSSAVSGRWEWKCELHKPEEGEWVYDTRRKEKYLVATNREFAQMQREAQRHSARLLGVSPDKGSQAPAERKFFPKKRSDTARQQAWIQRQHEGLHERESRYRHAQHVAVLKQTSGHSYQPQITQASRAIADAVKYRLQSQAEWLDEKGWPRDKQGAPIYA